MQTPSAVGPQRQGRAVEAAAGQQQLLLLVVVVVEVVVVVLVAAQQLVVVAQQLQVPAAQGQQQLRDFGRRWVPKRQEWQEGQKRPN